LGVAGASSSHFDFPLVDDILQLAGDLHRVVTMDAPHEEVRTTTDVGLIFFRPSNPAVIDVGFLLRCPESFEAIATLAEKRNDGKPEGPVARRRHAPL
jgi:hypothetical protein